MTRKKYNTEDENVNYDLDIENEDYDSEKEYLENQKYEYGEFQRENFEEREKLKWWDELTNYPALYHLRNLPLSWFEEVLQTGIRPVQYQTIFKDEMYTYPVYEQVPPEIENQGITQKTWELIC